MITKAALGAYLLAVFALFIIITNETGALTYGLDDAYIHLTLARNLWLNGTWGINPSEFAPASSSLLWTLLLAPFAGLPGVLHYTPVIINIICCVLLILIFGEALKPAKGSHQILGQALLLLSGPLLLLTFGGMEHCLHALICVLFIKCFQNKLSGSHSSALYGLGLAAVAVRYESLFLIFPCALLLAQSRKFFPAGLLLLTSLSPAVIFGIYSTANHWFFLPSTLVLKKDLSLAHIVASADFGSVLHYFIKLSNTLLAQSAITLSVSSLTIVLCVACIGLRKQNLAPNLSSSGLVVCIAVVAHFTFASVAGQAYRYEAYLLIISAFLLIQICTTHYAYLPELHRKSLKVVVLLLLLPRISGAQSALVISSSNIAEQQGAVADFVNKYYPNATVAMNDIGIVSYKTQAKIVDLFGLANLHIAQAKYNKKFGTQTLQSVAEYELADMAVVFESWFSADKALPATWTKVADWEHPCNFVCTDKILSFYAIREPSATLMANLKAYSSQLPQQVHSFYAGGQ